MTRPRTPWTGTKPKPKGPPEPPAAPNAWWVVTVEGLNEMHRVQGREPARQLACHLAEKHKGLRVRFAAEK